MPARFTVFVSSTVRDFGPIRRDLREWLEGKGMEVRLSEDPEFIVEPDVHSHEACLKAIDGCHLFILLVGSRWGGDYRDTKQSITWREYDEAVRLGIPVVKFVLRDVNEEAVRLGRAMKSRSGGPHKQHKGSKEPGLDSRLLGFINAIRKGRVNNWVHLDWDGSFAYLRRVVEARINSLFVAYQRTYQRLRIEAERQFEYAAARVDIDSLVASTPVEEIGRGRKARAWFAEFFEVLVGYREVLFGFHENDRYNFALYVRRGEVLEVAARQAHPSIKLRNRPWKMGEGHVGLAAARGYLLVSPNLAHTSGWRSRYATDAGNYVSAIAVPLVPGRSEEERPIGVFIVTSDRPDHFTETDQLEVLTAQSVGLMLTMLEACERVL